MVRSFSLAATPRVIFGSGKITRLPELAVRYGNNVLLITGRSSFIQSEHWDKLLLQFESSKIHWQHFTIGSEPTPSMIDTCVRKFSSQQIDVVVAIGGGSVVDAGKAISAMFCHQGSVKDYLEGVGTRQPSGLKVPFIAVPTTSGTGSEATKNAVISEVGINGFKKSLRHDDYVPDIALVDPLLALNCPETVTAQSGMDAFTQLLESYVSGNANPFTDAIAVEGLRHVRDGLLTAVKNGSDLLSREKMSLAALFSGMTLANAGLGTVHGFASSIGGFYDIPHGAICARLMAPVNNMTLEKLRQKDKDHPGLRKYARVGKLFSGNKHASDPYYTDRLMDLIAEYSHELNICGLSKFGVKEKDFEKIVAKTGNKNNPVALDSDELTEILKNAF